MLRVWLLLIVITLAAVGCKHRTLTPYVAPRVTGRVLDATTGQPVAQVKVWRNAPARREAEKAGEMLLEPAPARTDGEGRFELASERTLSPFRGGWSSVSLRFVHPQYSGFTTNFTLRDATNLPSGEPCVSPGDIHLAPKPAPRP